MTSEARGQRIGKYEVLAPLSVGGMAELLLGCHSGPGGFRKYVVIKRILPDAAQDETFVKMFLDEARVTAGFSHPNIAQVYDLGEDDEGLYVAMEFIAGQNLNQVMAACARQQAVLPIGFTVSVLHDCALALHYAHSYRTPAGKDAPVVHRDVAQKNIMVTYDGQVKLLDFGIAKARNALSRTKVGTVKGTSGYMSPEQVRGEEIDGRSDVFSLGVVLWEMVTGSRLFEADSEIAEMQAILSAEIRPPHEVEDFVPVELSDVIMRALARERSERFQTARDFARALKTDCAELFSNTEECATFMQERFEGRIEEAQALFSVADGGTPRAELNKVVQSWKDGAQDSDVQVLKAPGKPKAVKTGGAPRKKRKAPRKADAEADEQLLRAAIAAEAAGHRSSSGPGRNWGMPLMVLTGLLVVGAIAWGTWQKQTAPTKFGLQRFPGDPGGDDPEPSKPATLGNIPGQDLPDDRPPPPDTLPAGTAPIALPQDTPDEPVDTRKPHKPEGDAAKPKGKGDVMLALLPQATVFLKSKQLGNGSLMTVTLPAGTHLLTVVGPDGIKRKLSLRVKPGKNSPLKLAVDDLPPL